MVNIHSEYQVTKALSLILLCAFEHRKAMHSNRHRLHRDTTDYIERLKPLLHG